MAAVRNSKQQQQQQRSRSKSLRKRSTEIALNITSWLSSLFVSRLALGRHRPASERSAEVPVLLVLEEPPPEGGERVVESTSTTSKYVLMEPDGGQGVDSRADEFIQRVRERIRESDPATGKDVSKLPPSPSLASD